MATLNITPLPLDLNDYAPLSVNDINTKVNHEPRILDLRLAEVLGFERPRVIRELIARHENALSRFAEVCRTVRQTPEMNGSEAKGGRPAKAYWLTKKQAIYIASKSETDNATDILIHVIEVFDAVTQGKPVKVRAHRRAQPKPASIKAGTIPSNDFVLNMHQVIVTANKWVKQGLFNDFGTAMERVLFDMTFSRSCPLWKTVGRLEDRLDADVPARPKPQLVTA